MNVGQLYRFVIDDVIKNVKSECAAEGLDDNVLQELQSIWEMKLQQSGAVSLAMTEVSEYQPHTAYSYDLNNYNSTPYMPPHATYQPLDLSHNTLYGMSNQSYINTQPAPEMVAARPYNPSANTQIAANALRSLNTNPYDSIGKPQQYMAPGWNNSGQVTLNDVTSRPSTSGAGSLQNILRQHDGAGDQPEEIEETLNTNKSLETKEVDNIILKKYEEILKKKAEKGKKAKTIPQLDGKSEGSEEDEDEDSEGAAGDEELDSDLDDEDDLEPETENFVLCQYEKVTRIKNKRKTNLKDGIMHLNGRDSVFHKATGEFDW